MPRVLVALVALLLLVPASARAADLQPLIDAAPAGGTVTLAATDYTDAATIPATKTGLVIDGSAGGRITGSLTVAATGAILRQLALAPTATGLVVQSAGGVTLDRVLATRTATTDPVVNAAGTLALTDSTVLSTTGPAIAASGATTSIVRSTVGTTEPASNAVAFSQSETTTAKTVTSDSSILIGGRTSGAGLAATTTGGVPLVAVIGPVTVTLRHVTITGATGVALANNANAGGAITGTVNGSIVHPPSTTAQTVGAAPTLAFTASDSPQGQVQYTDAQVFGPNLRLLANAPVIGQGGSLADGESTTDIDGQPRATPTDMGADQFVNRAPTTGLTLSGGVVDEGATVTATLTPTDPDPGDTLAGYVFDWGDGTRESTKVPTATHTFPKAGVYTVRGATLDARLTPSNVATAPVTVRDTTAPAIRITSPKDGAKIKRGKRITITGTDTDTTGVAKVELALTRKNGKRCYQYGTRFKKAKCSKTVFKRATLTDATFSLKLRKTVKLAKGSYMLRARSVDGIGNATKGFSAKAGTLVRFRVK